MSRSKEMNFPEHYKAPFALFTLEGNCGPMSVWMILKRTSAERVLVEPGLRRHATSPMMAPRTADPTMGLMSPMPL
jgi:hypothetical protein